MQATDKERFSSVMEYLALNFPDRRVDFNLFKSYFLDLAEFTIEDFEKAAPSYVRTGDRFPYISDLIKCLKTLASPKLSVCGEQVEPNGPL